MAGFPDDWRKPSRLLQDVKTKSIERTLLPLIKQVSEEKILLTTSSSPERERKKISFRVKNSRGFLIHSCLWNGKLDGKWKWSFVNERRGIILVFVGSYFKIPAMCVNYIGCWTPLERVSFSLSLDDASNSHSSYHNISFSTSTIIVRGKIWKTRINLYFFAKLAP